MVHILLTIIYLSFISLGLPDGLLGAGWPTMHLEFQVPMSYAGMVSMIISMGTITSSLNSDRLTRRFGAGKVTACSVAMTAIAIFGFSISTKFWMICLWAIPYGLGAGSVDAALNNYVALHYASRHMSWLHCMWGVGASTGPYIMSFALTGGQTWNHGYRYVAIIQMILTIILVFSLPVWKQQSREAAKRNSDRAVVISTENGTSSTSILANKDDGPLTLKQILAIPGAKSAMITFFCYCALEQTAALWASSYLTVTRGVTPVDAAAFASMFFTGMTVGRAASGFITMKLNDTQMIRMGQGIIALGIAIVVLPLGKIPALVGLIIIGLGCAPIYPCFIHSTPQRFGEERSQAIIGVQMASAYVGTLLMPPLFGLVGTNISMWLFPAYLLAILILMVTMHEKLLKIY
ncbi:MAG: MFS transporter [Firmicutes bacterium]|nr:MFS transporter [Bacillota bacterium]